MVDKATGYYIGPKGENIDALKKLAELVFDFQAEYRKSFYEKDESLNFEVGSFTELEGALAELHSKYKKNYPYFHPRYMAQMLKDPAIPTLLGYLSFMMNNPNNHAYEGGPVTTEMEMEVVEVLKKMVGYSYGWGHLTSGGSLANTEALWAIRDFYSNDRAVYFSEVSHYSWKRICSILRMPNFAEIAVDKNFRMDLNVLEAKLKKNNAIAVIGNVGSTGSGSIDDIEGLLALKEKYGFHLHLDAAYGGFVRALLMDENYNPAESNILNAHSNKSLQLISESDSITIDPHKQGGISYGAGAVLYKNNELMKPILNSAPYTYHQTDKPNIGMFSLEGSRPGAMAAACWLTYRVMPPVRSGLGEIIKLQIQAAQKFYDLLQQSSKFENLHFPDLDINCFIKITDVKSVSELNKANLKIYEKLSVDADNPKFILSKFVISSQIAKRILPNYINENDENLVALRIVNLKHWQGMDDFRYIRELVNLLESDFND